MCFHWHSACARLSGSWPDKSTSIQSKAEDLDQKPFRGHQVKVSSLDPLLLLLP